MAETLLPAPPDFFDSIWKRYSDPRLFLTRLAAALELHGITRWRLAKAGGFQTQHIYRWFSAVGPAPSMGSMVMLDEALTTILRGEA